MDGLIPLIILVVVGLPIFVAIWLTVRALNASKRIEELSRRVGELEGQLFRLKREQTAPPATESAQPAPAAQPTRAEILQTKLEGAAAKPAEPVAALPPPPASVPVGPPPLPIVPPQPKPAAPTAPIAPPVVAASKPAPEPPVFATKTEARPAVETAQAKATPARAEKGSFEMRLGTYWLVRVGAVLVLTGLAFFGNLAYQKFSAGGKVAMLYFASALLLGAGAWWQRQTQKASMRNYAQVLFAGGLAAVYFTTYAAHHIALLRVIESAVLDGALLLAWAGFMAWIADRRKSEVLALFAVGLAYYTSVITQVGAFTLYSNLVLTLVAVGFLIRNRWAWLSLASLVATYAAYAFWRFFHGGEWHWATPEEGLWRGAYFLMSYWLVFTVAVFLSKHEKFTGPNRAGFLTLNNGSFFALFLLTMWQVHSGGFWKFSLGYGAVLLVLAEVARRILSTEPLARNAYLTQGLLLVTVGFIAKLSGMTLALVLAAESVVLLVLGSQWKSRVLQAGSYLSGVLAIAWGAYGLHQHDERGLWLGAGLGGLMLFNSIWSHRQTPEAQRDALLPVPSYFTALALAIWSYTTWQYTTPANFGPVLMLEALLLTFSIYVLRVREITLLAQLLVLVAHGAWQLHLLEHSAPPWWNPVLMIGATLGLGHWWQRQKAVVLESRLPLTCQFLLSLLVVLLACAWLDGVCSNSIWLWLACLLAVAVTAYAAATRLWLLAACAQLFLLPGALLFVQQLSHGGEPRLAALTPIVALGLLSFAAVRWFKQKPDANGRLRDSLLTLAMAYRWVALAMSLWWVLEYVPHREQIAVLMLLGLAVFAFAGWRRNREARWFGATYSAVAILLIWLRCLEPELVYLPNALAILAVLGQQRVAKRLPDRYDLNERVHAAVIIIGGLTLWLFVSRWVSKSASGFYLTASWSVLALALFACGMVLRERMYRWLGLGVLAAALGRVVVFDVWKLETAHRILSFMALGIVLLVLGFIYNKYQEKIRQWL